MSQDCWIASLSSGETIVEHWVNNEPSPWLRLMEKCKLEDKWLTNLRLTICSKTINLIPNAVGYWQIYQQSVLSNVPSDKMPVVRGIGFVEGNIVNIVWGVRTPANEPYFWRDSRSTEGQENIIWRPENTIVSEI